MGFVFLSPSLVYNNKLDVFGLFNWNSFCVLQSRVHEVWARFLSGTMRDDLRYTPSDCFETFPQPRRNSEAAEALEYAGKTYYEARAALMQSTNQGLTALYNRFTDPEYHDPAIVHLRELHATMDRAVLDAYGWSDLRPVLIHEREWEAEEGEKLAPWRLRWPEADRDEVLARLLDLNRRRKEEEALLDAPPPKPARRRAGRAAATAKAPLFGDDH
jgi:hypothetical protein